MNGYNGQGGGRSFDIRNLLPNTTGGAIFLIFVGALVLMGIITVQFSGHVQL